MAAPTLTAQQKWITNPGEDFLQLTTNGGGPVSWIDSTGALQGALTVITGPLSLTTFTTSADVLIHGLSAGLGSGSIATNAIFGANSLAANTTGTDNSAFGNSTLSNNTTASNNSAFGYLALSGNTTGNLNCAFGVSALFTNTLGGGNSAFGVNSLLANIDGGNNSAFGFNVMNSNTHGSNNTALGFQAIASNTTGNTNVAVGSLAGRTTVVANGNTTGSNNTFLGYNTGAGNTVQPDHMTVIGADATGIGSNAIFLGRANGSDTVNVPGILSAATLIETTTHTPSSATDTGTTGQIAWDSGFIYVCIATNSWKRVAIAAGF